MVMWRRVKVLAERIIKNAFRESELGKILYIILPFKFYALSFWVPPLIGIIVVSTKARRLSDKALTGLIAHELCHQERYRKMGVLSYYCFVLKYTFSQKARIEEEHEVDRMAVRKGFAAELHELTIITHASKSHKKIISNYLTPDEIVQYAQNEGLWNRNSNETAESKNQVSY